MTDIPEENKMPRDHLRLLGILRRHAGVKNAISLIDLFEEWSGRRVARTAGGRPTESVPTLSRTMRRLVDDLRDIWGIPVMSSSAHGYWMVTSRMELTECVHEFNSRGLKSLQTAARLKKISLVDAVQQLAIDLENDDSDLRRHLDQKSSRRFKPSEEDLAELTLSGEAKMAVITKHLQELLQNPQEFADQIQALQRQFGPKLLPVSVISALEDQARSLQEQATSTFKSAEWILGVLHQQ